MKECELSDRYRDGELSDFQAEEFRRHLASCRECGPANAALDNLVFIMRHEAVPVADMADRIARRAFERFSSWDGLLASWFRPRLAFTTGCLSVILCVFIWFAPENGKDEFMAYETLLDMAETCDPAGELLMISDSDFALKLLVGGNTQ